MSKKKSNKKGKPAMKRDSGNNSEIAIISGEELFKNICRKGYVSLDRNPEIVTACERIADLVSSMTIYLMSNTDKGDIRIQNELSRHVDINPFKYMTRKNWMELIVMNMLLYGKGNAIVYPITENGILGDLVPVDPGVVTLMRDDGYGYTININGHAYDPEDMLHFVYRPDTRYPWKGRGFQVIAQDVANNLKQAQDTTNGFLSDNWKPSIIVKVDSNTDALSSPEEREKILKDYLETNEAGEPWLIPAELMSVETVKPLTLSDLAISDTIKIDKATAATIIGVPPFVLGVGDFNQQEWNNFINSKIMPLAENIQQELTRKLLLNPKWYFKFNIQSLYSYDMKTLMDVYKDCRAIGVVTGNEVRDKLSLDPKEGLDELVMLENYIPTDKLGDQLKLKQEEE